MRLKKWLTGIVSVLLLSSVLMIETHAEEVKTVSIKEHTERKTSIDLIDLTKSVARFLNQSGLNFTYPDAVRGIYVTAHSAGGSRFNELVNFVNETELNAMVIDIKEDHGHLSFIPDEDSDFAHIAENYISDPEEMMRVLEENQIYPIARIVVFKDSVLAKERPDLSFTENGKVWVNNRGEAFVNPFEKEVWEYNVEIAKLAAELGFQEIQFDYVRFPEGFEKKDQTLNYSLGDYADLEMDNVKKRIEAVTDFVSYAREELSVYDVDVSVDIFGYAATLEETPGIGQNFSRISENVDIISSMIYPSHWSNGYFDIPEPDREPYRLVAEYAVVENEVLGALEQAPISRPWLQDFEAPWLYSGNTQQYGVKEVEAQIRALYENGINEFLLWNAGNTYTKGVNYLIGK